LDLVGNWRWECTNPLFSYNLSRTEVNSICNKKKMELYFGKEEDATETNKNMGVLVVADTNKNDAEAKTASTEQISSNHTKKPEMIDVEAEPRDPPFPWGPISPEFARYHGPKARDRLEETYPDKNYTEFINESMYCNGTNNNNNYNGWDDFEMSWEYTDTTPRMGALPNTITTRRGRRSNKNARSSRRSCSYVEV